MARENISTRSLPSRVQRRRTAVSRATKAGGLAKLCWDSVDGADAYIVVRDGNEIAGPLRIEGSQKEWTDKVTL